MSAVTTRSGGLPPGRAPPMASALASEAPLVKITSSGSQCRNAATSLRALSMAARAARPAEWMLLAALPQLSVNHGSMAARTSSRTRVEALLSRYTDPLRIGLVVHAAVDGRCGEDEFEAVVPPLAVRRQEEVVVAVAKTRLSHLRRFQPVDVRDAPVVERHDLRVDIDVCEKGGGDDEPLEVLIADVGIVGGVVPGDVVRQAALAIEQRAQLAGNGGRTGGAGGVLGQGNDRIRGETAVEQRIGGQIDGALLGRGVV